MFLYSAAIPDSMSSVIARIAQPGVRDYVRYGLRLGPREEELSASYPAGRAFSEQFGSITSCVMQRDWDLARTTITVLGEYYRNSSADEDLLGKAESFIDEQQTRIDDLERLAQAFPDMLGKDYSVTLSTPRFAPPILEVSSRDIPNFELGVYQGIAEYLLSRTQGDVEQREFATGWYYTVDKEPVLIAPADKGRNPGTTVEISVPKEVRVNNVRSALFLQDLGMFLARAQELTFCIQF